MEYSITIASGFNWGHDKIVMEVDVISYGLPRVGRLQWGHDKIVMEVT